MESKEEIVSNWLPRYTGVALEDFGKYILLTNFHHYVKLFSEWYNVPIIGADKPMPTATANGITIINFGIGSPNAALIMDLLSAIKPKAALFLGKCGGLKKKNAVGDLILPIAAVRGEGTSDDYLPPLVPALPSFKLHKFVSQKLVDRGLDYRTGVIYTTNRRVWEHDMKFREQLQEYTPIGIDMETATIFVVGHKNQIARGALLLVSDKPLTPEGVKTSESDARVNRDWSDVHLSIGIDSLTEIGEQGEMIKHFQY